MSTQSEPEEVLCREIGCVRCNTVHDELYFRSFHSAVLGYDGKPLFTHWALCPIYGEPILMRITEKDGNTFQISEVRGVPEIGKAAYQAAESASRELAAQFRARAGVRP